MTHQDAAIKAMIPMGEVGDPMDIAHGSLYLASDDAQRYFADGNNEWPVVPSVPVSNAELKSLGSFKSDTLNVGELAKTTAQAQKVFDRAGWK